MKKQKNAIQIMLDRDKDIYDFLVKRNLSNYILSDGDMFGYIDKDSPISLKPDRFEKIMIGNAIHFRCRGFDLEKLYKYYYEKNKDNYSLDNILSWLSKYGDGYLYATKPDSKLAKDKATYISKRGCYGTFFRKWILYRYYPEIIKSLDKANTILS